MMENIETSNEEKILKTIKRKYNQINSTADSKCTDKEFVFKKQKKIINMLISRSEGAYIFPNCLKMIEDQMTDKTSVLHQRFSWEELKKSIQGCINKLNARNIVPVIRELLKNNIVRGRGILAQSIIIAQDKSPELTDVYAAFVAIINSIFPFIGKLILTRLAIKFKEELKKNNLKICISIAVFIGHLLNQSVAEEVIILEVLANFFVNPTDDTIEITILLLKLCGKKIKISQVYHSGYELIFEILKKLLYSVQLDKNIQYKIVDLILNEKDGFKKYEMIPDSLNFIEESNQFTHFVTIMYSFDDQNRLNLFHFDKDYIENEDKYKKISEIVLETSSESESEY